MADPVTLIHITDPHLLGNPSARLGGWDVTAAFERVLDAALAAHPDAGAIVLGGDLVDDESAAGYHWLDQRLAGLGRPVLAIAGNHDDPHLMAEQLSAAVVHDALAVGPWRLIGVSSHQSGQESGRVGEAGLAYLEARLAADAAPTLVCIHHPPFDVGSAWVDGIGLTDRRALMTTLDRHAHVHGLLCGHVHQAHRAEFEAMTAWSTPSTMRQFLPHSRDFAEDTTRTPGYRCLQLAADGSITTAVHRLASGPR